MPTMEIQALLRGYPVSGDIASVLESLSLR